MALGSNRVGRPPAQRVLVLCTHNSARSQMAEGWIRHLAARRGLPLEVHSAGTEPAGLKPEAVRVMAEIGIDISGHRSKALTDVPEPWEFDLVITVCDQAAEVCPVYPARTLRIHVSFKDPAGCSLETWREVRDALGRMAEALVSSLERGQVPTEEQLRRAAFSARP